MTIDDNVLDQLTREASQSPRLRMNLDMRTTPEDHSQRMLNALQPGTVVPIHRHPMSTETVCVLRGRILEKFFSEEGALTHQVEVAAGSGCPFCVVPQGVWHTTEALQPGTIIFEAKDRPYGQDGSQTFPANT